MPKFKTVTGIAPSFWAVYLINGDATIFDYQTTPDNPDAADKELAQADAFAAWLGGHIVDAVDYGFAWSHDATRFGVKGADCQTYTALIQESDE